jgi:hypothetical protein
VVSVERLDPGQVQIIIEMRSAVRRVRRVGCLRRG